MSGNDVGHTMSGYRHGTWCAMGTCTHMDGYLWCRTGHGLLQREKAALLGLSVKYYHRLLPDSVDAVDWTRRMLR